MMTAGSREADDSSRTPASTRPDTPEYEHLATELRNTVKGAVRFDDYTRVLYATDGSIYQAQPAGVVFPTDTADVQTVMRLAARHGVPVLPRGAGSSLAGQAVGPGCLVLDTSRHMDGILDVDPDARRATVQPGVVQDRLDAHLDRFGLQFAPDPASGNRATIGGGIGNNSTGAHSVRYGITDAYVDELDVVLADGSLIHTREVIIGSSEWENIVGTDDLEAELYRTVLAIVEDTADEIADRFPDLKRCVSGYNLQKVVYETDDGEQAINLSKLIVGSEGTLGVVVEATLSLVSTPERTALVLYCFSDLIDAMAAVPDALAFEPSAVELMDSEVFRLASESPEYARYTEAVPDGCEAALMLEFDSECHDDFKAAIAATNAHFLDTGTAFDAVEALDESEQDDLWKLRKAAIPLLMSLEGDPKPYPFIEDATVPPEDLAAYVQSFQSILAEHDTSAAYFAHAGSGTLHIRPILNLKTGDGVETMRAIAGDVTDLVLEYHGSFSGEHGDGLARTEFNPKMYGPDLWKAFKQIKTTFDPEWRLNPGTVVFQDDAPTDMREHLRYGPDYAVLESETTLDFDSAGGFTNLVELCNGCGTCRQTEGDTMCPTYRASKEEIATTRGRANLLRAAISGELPESERYTERFQRDVLDLCVGCKGCASDCPTGVDLAKLKAEVKHQYHKREGASRRAQLFADVDRLSSLGSTLAPLSNWVPKIPGVSTLLKHAVGIAPDRELPTFRRRTFTDWFEKRGSLVSPADATRNVVLFPDTFTNGSYPEIGRAAVAVLEAAGIYVHVPDNLVASGRAAYSTGFLDIARERARRNVETLAPLVSGGWDVVFVEPSDAVMFQDEYLDLLDGVAVEQVAGSAYGVCEYLDAFRLTDDMAFDGPNEHLTYHAHCNQKALGTDHHAVGLLRRAGYEVDPLDSGCCGMAGSFGYEAEHYDLSQAIGEILFRQVDDSDGETVVAPGASCRTQLGDRPGASRPPHPIEKLAEALVE